MATDWAQYVDDTKDQFAPSPPGKYQYSGDGDRGLTFIALKINLHRSSYHFVQRRQIGQIAALGTECIYEASSEDAIRQHAAAADLAVTEIVPIADTVVVRPDPE